MQQKALLQRLFEKFIYKRSNTGEYAKYIYDLQRASFSGINESGEIVSVDRGAKLHAVFTSINAISQDIAKLPIDICKDSRDGGQRKYYNHNVSKLVNISPNANMGAFNFWYWMVFNALREKATAYIVRENGIPVEMIPFYYDEILKTDSGEYFYKYKGQNIPARDVFHLKMYTFDGYESVSPIVWNAELMGYRMKVRKYATKIIGTAGTGFLSSEGISQEEGQELAKNLKSAMSEGHIPFIGASGKTVWNRQMITPEEGQYLETAVMSDRDIRAIFRFPNALANDNEHSSHSNAEQQDLVYMKYTLTPWARLIEDEINKKLFTEANKAAEYPYYAEFDFKEMLRADMKSRKEYYMVMKDGIMTPNEIRAMEGLPPIEGGDKVMIQGANIPLDSAEENENENEKTGNNELQA